MTADLRRFDVFDFPLRTAVHWTDDGYLVELVVVTAVRDEGYSSVVLMDHTVPYGGGSPAGDGTAQAAELDSALQQAHAAFGERLARALRTEPRPGQPLS